MKHINNSENSKAYSFQMPQLNLPVPEDNYLRHLTIVGAIQRYGQERMRTDHELRARIKLELSSIAQHGISALFIILADFMRAAREEMDIIVGPGRSSIAGSIVAYCLQITAIDPLQYGLLFERLYYKESGLPEIDIDLDYHKKQKAINYLTKQYGELHLFGIVGLIILSKMKKCIKLIKQNHSIDLDINTIPNDDEKTLRLFQQGLTIGVFLFESNKVRNFLREFQPTNFEELTALNVCFLPHSVEYISSLIARKQGKEAVVYEHPILEKYLKGTYGIITYQEQVMLLCQTIANFTPDESFQFHKHYHFQQPEITEMWRCKFMDGGKQNGYEEQILVDIWQKINNNFLFHFLKSHAVCYTRLAYQTAYLKAHFPNEFRQTIK